METLIDREIQHNINNTKFISDLKIQHNHIYFKLNKEWVQVIHLDEFVKSDIENYLKSYLRTNDSHISNDVETQLREIHMALRKSWNESINKYNLTYDYNKNGQLHKIYIPVNSDYINDIFIHEIYNKNGEFVAHELEDNLLEPLYKIEHYNLVTNTIDSENAKLYKKTRAKFSDIFVSEFTKLWSVKHPISLLPAIILNLFIAMIPVLIYIHKGIDSTITTLGFLTGLGIYPLSLFFIYDIFTDTIKLTHKSIKKQYIIKNLN